MNPLPPMAPPMPPYVAAGADGAEMYGVRKKHVLRGTKYSLPKPKVGAHD